MDVREKLANERRLIDADALMDVIRQHEYRLATKQGSIDYGMFTLGIQQAVDEQKTIDAVEVVRCRDCQHWKPSGSKAGNSFSNMEYIGGCEFTNYYRRESDFCSYGERKEGAD